MTNYEILYKFVIIFENPNKRKTFGNYINKNY